MFDALVMTLGFEPGPLISAMASAVAEGLSENSRIIVLTAGFKDERAERAWLQLQTVIGMMEIHKKLAVSVEKHEIRLDDFATAVLDVKKILNELEDKRVKISITGGMRALGLAVFTVYLLIKWKHTPSLEVYLEGRGMALPVPEIKKFFEIMITGERYQLIKMMKPGEFYKPTVLATALGKDRSTVYRHLKALAKMGIVNRTEKGFSLSRLGQLLI